MEPRWYRSVGVKRMQTVKLSKTTGGLGLDWLTADEMPECMEGRGWSTGRDLATSSRLKVKCSRGSTLDCSSGSAESLPARSTWPLEGGSYYLLSLTAASRQHLRYQSNTLLKADLDWLEGSLISTQTCCTHLMSGVGFERPPCGRTARFEPGDIGMPLLGVGLLILCLLLPLLRADGRSIVAFSQ